METTNNILSVHYEGAGATVKFSNSQGKNSHVGELPVHEDFKNALRELDIHFCFLSGQIEIPRTLALEGANLYDFWSFQRIKDAIKRIMFNDIVEYEADWECISKPILENMTCYGFSFKGTSERGVQLTGSRLLDYCNYIKDIQLTTPTHKFIGDIYDYPYLSELKESVEKLALEADLYIFGKNGAVKQGEFDFDTEQTSEDDAPFQDSVVMIEGAKQALIEEPKKKGSKKKELPAPIGYTDIVEPEYE